MIDWDKLAELRDDIGAEEFDEVVTLFFDDTETCLAGVQDGPSQDGALHYLKGSAMTMGFADLAAMCREGEAALRRGQPVDIAAIRACYFRSREAFLAGPADTPLRRAGLR